MLTCHCCPAHRYSSYNDALTSTGQHKNKADPPGGMSHWGLTSSASIKTRKEGIFFATWRITRLSRVKGIKNRKIWKKGIKFTYPGLVRKGRKSGSDTTVRTRGVVFRELWVPSLHSRLGCFSESDWRGWCTSPNDTCPPGADLTHYPVYYPFASTHMVNTQLLHVQMCIQNIANIFAGFWICAWWVFREIHEN